MNGLCGASASRLVTPHRARRTPPLRAELAGLPLCGEAAPWFRQLIAFQGQERDAVLAGYTVSDPEFRIGGGQLPVQRLERLNVTVTRSRSKLVRCSSASDSSRSDSDRRRHVRRRPVAPPGEYVFDTDPAGSVELPAPDGPELTRSRSASRRFPADLQPSPPTPETVAVPPTPPQTVQPVPPALAPVLDAVRNAVTRTGWGAVSDSSGHARPEGRKPTFESCGASSPSRLTSWPHRGRTGQASRRSWSGSPRAQASTDVPVRPGNCPAGHRLRYRGRAAGYPVALYPNVRGQIRLVRQRRERQVRAVAGQARRGGRLSLRGVPHPERSGDGTVRCHRAVRGRRTPTAPCDSSNPRSGSHRRRFRGVERGLEDEEEARIKLSAVTKRPSPRLYWQRIWNRTEVAVQVSLPGPGGALTT